MPAWCYDLTSATDRFPIILQQSLLNRVFKNIKMSAEIGFQCLGDMWADTISKGPWSYRLGNESRVMFDYVGQPMGAYSSWAVFSLSHHVLIWTLALECGLS